MAKKKENKKLGKFTKILAITASILVILPCLAIAVFGVLDVAQVFPLLSEPRSYRVKFISDEIVLFDQLYLRGEKLEVDITPTHGEDKFVGWDIDGNNIPDVIPSRVYMNIVAEAIWKEVKESE